MWSAETARGIDLLFDAAIDKVPWSCGLDAISRTFEAGGAVIMAEDPRAVELGVPISGLYADIMPIFLAEGWYRNDLRAVKGWPMIASGAQILLEQQLSTEAERRREPYYQEFVTPLGMPWWVGLGFAAEGKRWALCLTRGQNAGPFEPKDALRLKRLRPHLVRVVTLAHEFRDAAQRGNAMLMDRARTPAIALGFDGKVQWFSPEAIEVMGQQISISNGRLMARNHVVDGQLQRIVAEASAARTPSAQPEGSVLVVSNGTRPAFLLDVSTLPRTGVDAFSRVAAVMFVRRIGGDKLVDPTVLVRLLGLTPGEAAVASLVGSGLPGPAVALRLGVSYETVRTHLSRVFQKLSINRQAELVEILANLRFL